MSQTLLIDADDTLWENNIYFERAIARFIEFLNHHEFKPEQVREVLNDVELNQVVVSFGPPELTTRIVEGIQDNGTCWCGPTVWQGRTAMRISVSSWATTDEDVERSLGAMVSVATRLSAASDFSSTTAAPRRTRRA